MRKCSNCGKEFDMGMFSLVGDMCDKCYEKVNFYTPDNNYVKDYIKREFKIPEGEYSSVDLLIFFSECEGKVYDEIKKMCIDRKKHFSTVFREFDPIEKMKELVRTGHTELEFSFFFADTLLDTNPNFEDRNKYRNVIFQ